jgi:hypothetical protein
VKDAGGKGVMAKHRRPREKKSGGKSQSRRAPRPRAADIKESMLRLIVRVVDAFFHYEDRQKVLRALQRLAGDAYTLEPLNESQWIAVPTGANPDERIDLLFATGDPEESAIEMATKKRYKTVEAPMFSVVWLVVTKYLAERDDVKDMLDIYALNQRGAFDISAVVQRLKQMGFVKQAAVFPGFMQRLAKLREVLNGEK